MWKCFIFKRKEGQAWKTWFSYKLFEVNILIPEIIDPRTASQTRFPFQNSLKNICIRDIVSDADKLDAIGYAGIERCRDFSKYRAPNASCEEIEENVVEHMHDKLLKLLDQYIRTDSAKTIGQPLQKEMLDYLENKWNHCQMNFIRSY